VSFDTSTEAEARHSYVASYDKPDYVYFYFYFEINAFYVYKTHISDYIRSRSTRLHENLPSILPANSFFINI